MTTKPNDLQRLLAEEPFVRALAHSLVADEADDIVQQAFLQALQQQPADLQQPRSWLARIVRNLIVDHRRRHARRDSRELAVAPRDPVPSSSELLEGEDRRRALVAAVDGLPAEQRTVVLLRYYDGLPPRRIAAQLGLPVATVWNRLHAALQTLRVRLDAEHGHERRRWLLPLVPFATLPRALPWRDVALGSATPTLVMGVIAMTTKTKIVAAVAALLMLAVAWVAWPRSDVPGDRPGASPTDAGGAVASALQRPRDADTAADTPAREAADAPKLPASITGALVVRARYAGEPSVAAGITVTVGPPGADFRVGLHRAITDAAGLARFDGLAPGTVRVESTMRAASARAEIRAGTTSECTLQMRGTMTVTGVVVDAGGVPIGGALVEAAGFPGADADQVAVTAADGTFSIRECFVHCLVGARAQGYAASQLYSPEDIPGGTENVRIELRPNGGAVEGIVVDPTGRPVAGAVVRVGEGRTEGILGTPQGAPPLPAQVRTDAAGRFRAIGVPDGTQPVQVRTVDLSPWRGTCEVAAGTTVAVRITLAAGITCTGIVRGEGGEPATDADVSVGDPGDFVLLRTRSGRDGTFTLAGLPIGEFTLAAEKDRVGKATAKLRGQPGEPLRCELQLSNGLALRARVLDAVGTPVEGVEIRCVTEDTAARWTQGAYTDKEGRFVVADCPPGRTLALLASKRDHVTLQLRALLPGGPELELCLQRDAAAKARITGRLLRPDGSPATGEEVEAIRSQTRSEAQLVLSAKVRDDGSFVIEAPAGLWLGRILVKGHPEIRLAPGKLEAGAAWDAGVLQLTVGGTLVARIYGVAKTDSYTVLDTREHAVCSLWPPVTPLRSDLIAPGDYLLLAQGEGIKAQVLPFTIHSGQQTELTVQRRPGVRQWIEFEFPPGTEPPGYIEFQVRSGTTMLAWSSAGRSASYRRAVWLAPGSYTLATQNREPQATATFSVGDTEGPPVRIVLR